MTPNDVSVFVVGDDEYFPGLLALLRSLRKNDPATGPATILFDNELAPFSEERRRLLTNLWPDCQLVNCTGKFKWASSAKHRTSLISLLKFEIFRILPTRFGIYLDTDILVLGRISDCLQRLADSRLGFCAVENRSLSTEYRVYSSSLFPINAGFFVLDSKHLPCREIYQQLEDGVLARRDSLLTGPAMVCQPIMNSVLAERRLQYLAAPMSFNFRDLETSTDEQINSATVLHFVTRGTAHRKPWQVSESGDAASGPAQQIWNRYSGLPVFSGD